MSRYSLWVELGEGGERVTLSDDVQQEQIGPFVGALSRFPLSGPIDVGVTITPQGHEPDPVEQSQAAGQQTPQTAPQTQASVMQGGKRRTHGVGQ